MRKIVLIRNANAYDFGGAERFPVFLAEILNSSGFEPVIISKSRKLLDFANDRGITSIRGWWWKQQNWSGIRALLFPVYILWQLILFFWYLIIFIRIKPDIVHIQSKDDFIAATFAAKLRNSKIVWTDHADLKHVFMNHKIWFKNPVGKLVHLASKLADSITVVSKSELSLVTNNLRKRDPTIKKIHVIYNGVTDTRSAYPKPHGSKHFTYCVVSRLVTDKGIGEVIEAFNKLLKKYPTSRMVIVGNGPQSEQFEKQADGNNQISFLGYQKDPISFMAQSDVFVQPTYHEGFSISLVEASMMAMPIIATAVGGNLEIIEDGQTGLLVKPRDIDSLYTAMVKLQCDDALRRLIGRRSRQQYEDRFNFSNIVKNDFIPLYKGSKK